MLNYKFNFDLFFQNNYFVYICTVIQFYMRTNIRNNK
uniref:Uncharacterized protein n=1 Tax=Myoviridae sp. ctrCp2 TaxID=2825179 RepID=A0A8S5NYT9_9CAUD|nr:MAG TPA: hypothetical protein [Myoviridae sp. ctrCp2]